VEEQSGGAKSLVTEAIRKSGGGCYLGLPRELGHVTLLPRNKQPHASGPYWQRTFLTLQAKAIRCLVFMPLAPLHRSLSEVKKASNVPCQSGCLRLLPTAPLRAQKKSAFATDTTAGFTMPHIQHHKASIY